MIKEVEEERVRRLSYCNEFTTISYTYNQPSSFDSLLTEHNHSSLVLSLRNAIFLFFIEARTVKLKKRLSAVWTETLILLVLCV